MPLKIGTMSYDEVSSHRTRCRAGERAGNPNDHFTMKGIIELPRNGVTAEGAQNELCVNRLPQNWFRKKVR